VSLRALFLLLLLLNVLFLAWATWVAPPADLPGHATPASDGPPAIRLLREATAASGLGTSGALGHDAADISCVSGGPFRDRGDAVAAAARLERLGFVSRLRESREEIRVGLWVRVVGLATPADVANALAAVRAAGISDAYVLRDDPPGTDISLGIFNDSGRAGEIADVATKLGLVTQTTDRIRPEDVFWVDVDRQANAGLPSLEVLQGEGGDGPGRLELRPCPAVRVVTPVTSPP
jgi:hypothetical protein